MWNNPRRSPQTPAPTQPPVSFDLTAMNFSFTSRELSGAYSQRTAVVIEGKGKDAVFSGAGVAFSDQRLIINKEGVYLLKGNLEDVTVVIAADAEEKVQLVLDDARISCSFGPALYIQSGDKVFITLPEGTESSLSDGSEYDAAFSAEGLDAALFSRSDLCINGAGILNIQGNYRHGAVSKDDLAVISAQVRINAPGNGLEGKDCIRLSGCTLDIHAGEDGMQSDNQEDAHRGFIYLQNANLSITSGSDGIQAYTVLKTENASVHLSSGGGSSQALTNDQQSFKGMKAGGDILISGGEYILDCRDDCIHANQSVTIVEGVFLLSSGDDGIHADDALTIRSGEIEIQKSYEGIEASVLSIAGGKITVQASDDGLNGAGGADGSSMGGRFGRGGFSRSTGSIDISGGSLFITSGGDGIDSNGNITVSGGDIRINGPASNGNNAFDFDGQATVTGGTLIALGSSGMAQNFSYAENQGAILCTFSMQQPGVQLALLNENGETLLSFAPEKSFQCALITCPALQPGCRYTLTADGKTLTEIEMTSLLYSGGQGGNRRNEWGPGRW